tara:strand:- start:278 stop:1555 length:1278 start_codon:yes stop_codon:yes gene_type:complete
VNKFLFYILFLIFLSNCSSSKKEDIVENTQEIDLFKKIEPIRNELNPGLSIQLSDFTKERVFLKNNTNNNGNINFTTNFEKKFYYKFKKIKKFKSSQPELIFTKNNSVIFFDGKGSIFKINENFKKIWKVNNYNKKEKKMDPILYFAQDGKNLIVTDSLSKFYAINLTSGEIIWSKYNLSSFNSNIKINNGNFIAVDFDNVIRCFSIKEGKEIWNFKSENSLVKSQKKLSLVLKNNIVFFINNLGDVTALNSNDGSLLWQTPTQSNIIYQEAFSLENSDLVLANDNIYFSNNKNEFFSIDSRSGVVKWKQTINSSLRPTVIKNYVITVSQEGFLFVIEENTGNVLRISNTFINVKNKNNEIKPVGFLIAKNKIYLSLNNGRIIKIDLKSGVQENIFKLHGSKISRPYIHDGNMYLIKDNAIIKVN